jgi:hypothetical protein
MRSLIGGLKFDFFFRPAGCAAWHVGKKKNCFRRGISDLKGVQQFGGGELHQMQEARRSPRYELC